MTDLPDVNSALSVRLLTAPAPGAIAVVELRGSGAVEVLRSLTRKRTADQRPDFVDHRLVLCRVVDGDETLDDAIAVAWADGTAAEIQVHGGPRIVQRLIERMEEAGATRVDRGDPPDGESPLFDWVEAEVDAVLMRAQTRHMARWLLAQRRLLPELVRGGPPRSIDPALARRARAAAALVRGLTVAIVGPPNAGKSTLANRLIGHDRVITSDLPGTTRDWVSETAAVRGWQITLTDTAGIRATADPIEREAIRRGVGVAHGADLILVVVDACKAEIERANDLAATMLDLPADRPRLIVLNKCDLLSPAEDGAIAGEPLQVSALTGAGRDALEAAIVTRLGLDSLEPDAPAPFSARQWAAIGLPDADRI